MNRRDFFSSILTKGLDALTSTSLYQKIEEATAEKRLPPGASPQFESLCTGCDRCMAACPFDALLIDDLDTRIPFLYLDDAPCSKCSEMPCISSCPTDALTFNGGAL